MNKNDIDKMIAPSLQQIKEQKLNCIVHTKAQEEADRLIDYLGVNVWTLDTWKSFWEVFKEETCYKISNGVLWAYSNSKAYEDETVYDFSDIANFEKEDNKMNATFDFNAIEYSRIDKSNNTRVPTIETTVWTDTGLVGSATCDKVDYNERQGILEAIANVVCGNNFEREYRKVIKSIKFTEKKARTCTYCGKLFNTKEEKKQHEAWHIECKKARRERYLLRKRAKEIAFEEKAQELAKEMITRNTSL